MDESKQIAQLEKQVKELKRELESLDKIVGAIRQNTSRAIQGHAGILESLVFHTKYRPTRGSVIFPTKPVDVGRVG